MKDIKKMITIGVILLLSITVAQARVACKQFSDQSEAQRYYENKKKGYKSLDRDKDGEACECLPGGSAYGKSVCKRWRKKYGK